MGSITVSNLSKSYKRYNNKWARLKEWITGKNNHTSHLILKNINFEISAGEAVGIIGVNGAGKSTLLKLITGTTRPTEGEIKLNGSVSALLELGLGFNPDFTGRQNAHISAQLQGFDNATIIDLIPSIEEFAEIGRYFDEPMRTYSSGMQMRVAFSVATAKRPDILIVDEALSVGDAYFQHKSFNRIRQFRDLGTTILFVSHSAGAIKTLCNRAILLDNGIIVRDGSPDTVMDYYNAVIAQSEADHKIKQAEHLSGKSSTRSGNFAAKIEQVEILVDEQPARAITMGAAAILLIRGQINQDINELTVGMVIRDRLGNEVFGTNTHHHHSSLTNLKTGQNFAVEFQFPSLALGRGTYSISIALHSGNDHVADNYDWWDRAIVFQILPNSAPSFVGVFNVPLNIKWTTDGIHTQQTFT